MNEAKGINWVTNLSVNGKKVISMSFAYLRPAVTRGFGDVLGAALKSAYQSGCLLVAAAGNDDNTQPSYDTGPSGLYDSAYYTYPASSQYVISVAATNDVTDMLAPGSHYGSWVSVAAPGVNIYSSVPNYPVSLNYGVSGRSPLNANYDYISGTSMACPHVSGEAALLWSQNPSLTNQQVHDFILNNTDPVTPYPGHGSIGGGRVNAYKALVAATPHGSDVKLLAAGNYLYGTTLAGGAYSRGAIFQVDPNSQDNHAAGSVLYSFTGGTDGAHPFGGLILGQDGYLYGTCSQGGQYGLGTVFRLLPSGSNFAVVLHIGAYSGGSDAYGSNPRCALQELASGGTFVGVTPNGGSSHLGTVFATNSAGGFLPLYSFVGGAGDGVSPVDGVTLGSDGYYWGVTTTGGMYNLGTVFRQAYSTTAGAHSIAYQFGQTSGGSAYYGAYPHGLLLEGTGTLQGIFLSATQAGGANGSGLVFATNAQGGFNALYNFTGGTDGGTPLSGLLLGSDGAFWGTTSAGGQYGFGTVYRQTYTTAPAGHTTSQQFGDFSGGSAQNGAYPRGALTLGLGAYATTYFGATSQGGDFGQGCVYALNASGGRRTIFMFPANF